MNINYSNIDVEVKELKVKLPTKQVYHKINYTKWSNKLKRSDLPVENVYCFHRLMGTGRDFDKVANALVNENPQRIVISPDVAGRGKSEYLKDATDYQYATYINDAIELIKATKQSNEIDYIGTSMGGLIGILTLASLDTAPSNSNIKVRRMILNDVGPYVPLDSLNAISKNIQLNEGKIFTSFEEGVEHFKSIYHGFGELTHDEWCGLAYDCIVNIYPHDQWRFHYDPAIKDNFNKVTQDIDLWSFWFEALKKIQQSVLIIRGNKSNLLTKEVYEKMIDSDRNRIKGVEFESGHAPSLVKEDQLRVILDFLK